MTVHRLFSTPHHNTTKVSAICLSDAQDGAKLDNSNLSTFILAGTAGHAMWRLKLAPSDRNKEAGARGGGSARRRCPGSATRSAVALAQGRVTTANEAMSESRQLIAGHHGCLRGLAMMDFGLGLSDLFVTAGEDGILRVWDASTRRPTSYNNIGGISRKRGGKSKYKLPGQATCVDLCPDDSRAGEVAIGFSRGGMAIMGTLLECLRCHTRSLGRTRPETKAYSRQICKGTLH